MEAFVGVAGGSSVASARLVKDLECVRLCASFCMALFAGEVREIGISSSVIVFPRLRLICGFVLKFRSDIPCR